MVSARRGGRPWRRHDHHCTSYNHLQEEDRAGGSSQPGAHSSYTELLLQGPNSTLSSLSFHDSLACSVLGLVSPSEQICLELGSIVSGNWIILRSLQCSPLFFFLHKRRKEQSEQWKKGIKWHEMFGVIFWPFLILSLDCWDLFCDICIRVNVIQKDKKWIASEKMDNLE